MNFIDIAIIVFMLLSMYWGVKTGLFATGIYVVGLLVGWAIAGQVAPIVGEVVDDESLDSLITTLSYIFVVGASIVTTRSILKLIKPASTIIDLLTLGLNRLIGAILGLILGLAISCIVISGLARITYDFTVIEDISQNIDQTEIIETEEIIATIYGTQSDIENALLESTAVPIIIFILDLNPIEIPGDFLATIEILDSKLDDSQ
ncbi:MAG: CvpA family protein [SAR202 cluster bacterium]|nr:MAG: CvpA family protein [SAR202 cluster bacterium]